MVKKKYSDKCLRKAATELEVYKNLEATIVSLSKQKERIEERIHGINAVDYEKVRVAGNPPSQDIVETYVDIQAKIGKLEAEKQGLKLTIEVKLGMLSDLEQQVLRMYYIDQLSIFDISSELHFSERWVIHKKRTALEAYSKLFL